MIHIHIASFKIILPFGIQRLLFTPFACFISHAHKYLQQNIGNESFPRWMAVWGILRQHYAIIIVALNEEILRQKRRVNRETHISISLCALLISSLDIDAMGRRGRGLTATS